MSEETCAWDNEACNDDEDEGCSPGGDFVGTDARECKFLSGARGSGNVLEVGICLVRLHGFSGE